MHEHMPNAFVCQEQALYTLPAYVKKKGALSLFVSIQPLASPIFGHF